MKERYPPRPRKKEDIALILAVLDSMFYERKVVYFSVPITTGKNFSDWHATFGKRLVLSNPTYIKEHRRHVIEPNRTRVERIANLYSRKFKRCMINPMLLKDLPGWTQDDYRALWSHIIENYVSTVIFADGWQYSNGCAYEFLIAHKTKIRTVDQRQSPLTLNKGIQLINSAINNMENKTHNVPTEFLESVKKELVNLKVRNWSKQ